MRIFKVLIGVFILLGLSFLSGCDNERGSKRIDLNKTVELDENFQEPNQLRIGIIPEQDIRKMAARYEPLAEYLGKKLNLKVTLVYLDNYGEVCDKFINQELDAAFFGSFSYALTHAKAGVEALSRPDYHGVSTYKGLIIVRKDSNIKNVADMKNKRLALVHQATYAGYLYPVFYFKGLGIDQPQEYFSRIIFTGSHDKAVFAVLRGEAEVAILKDLVYERIIRENPDLEKKLVVLSASEPVPSNALCVSKDLDPFLKNKINDILLNLDKDREGALVLGALGGASRFIKTEDADYHHLYDTIKALGIDLKVYPYYERPDIGFKAQ